jgi:SOS-response transcriptional repressor LexA
MDFWDRLKDQIKDMETTQEGVAKEIEVPYGTFRKWMDRKTYPDANEIAKIAQFLKTTVEYLVTGKPPEGISPEILSLARKIAALGPDDREDILALINVKLARYAPKPPLFVVEPAPKYPADTPKLENDVEYLDWEMIMIPYFGKTAAGEPLDINIPSGEFMPFPRQALKGEPEDHFYLKIQGYSMVEAGINEGDLVVIRKAEEPVNGKIMLVRHEGASTLKRLVYRNRKWHLRWDDGSGREIRVDSGNFQVQGVHIWTLKPGK